MLPGSNDIAAVKRTLGDTGMSRVIVKKMPNTMAHAGSKATFGGEAATRVKK